MKQHNITKQTSDIFPLLLFGTVVLTKEAAPFWCFRKTSDSNDRKPCRHVESHKADLWGLNVGYMHVLIGCLRIKMCRGTVTSALHGKFELIRAFDF